MRYQILDHIRGWTFVSMFLYHMTWDLVYLYGMDWEWYMSGWAYIWQQSICWSFILLSGFSWSMGKKKAKRGLLVVGASVLVSLVTCVFLPDERIVFGVLTFLGISMLLMILLEPLLRNIPPVAGWIGSFGLFFLLRNVNEGRLGFEALAFGKLPDGMYQNLFTAFLGFPTRAFFSTDYFSVIPWFFLFVTGYFLFRTLKERDTLHILAGSRELKAISFLGKHSLILYLLHQPVIYLLLLAGSELFMY